MSFCKESAVAIFAVVCLLGEATSSAFAQCSPIGGICATEWSHGHATLLPSLPGTVSSEATGINNAGQVVGWSVGGGVYVATEWSHGQAINLGGLPGSTDSIAASINDAGQAVGTSIVGGGDVATEWSNGQVISLPILPGFSEATGINYAGQVVGFINVAAIGGGGAVPEPSTWAMMLVGFAGLAFAGYRRSERVSGQNARL